MIAHLTGRKKVKQKHKSPAPLLGSIRGSRFPSSPWRLPSIQYIPRDQGPDFFHSRERQEKGVKLRGHFHSAPGSFSPWRLHTIQAAAPLPSFPMESFLAAETKEVELLRDLEAFPPCKFCLIGWRLSGDSFSCLSSGHCFSFRLLEPSTRGCFFIFL